MSIDLALVYIFSALIIGFLIGVVVTKTFDKNSRNTIKIISLAFLIFFSGLTTFIILRENDVPIFIQMIMLGLSAEVLGINLSEAFGVTERIQNLKKSLFKKDDDSNK